MHRLVAELPAVHVLHDEYERLADVICASPVATDALALLWSELKRAAIISPAHAPDDLVRMNSVVHYTDLLTGAQSVIRLVYAENDHLGPGDVPITTTLGAAMIGLRPGAMFAWTEANLTCAIRINAVGRTLPDSSQHRRPNRRSAPPAEQPGTSAAALNRPVTVHIRPRRSSAMQSAPGGRGWVLSFEPATGPASDPLMGWTATGDPLASHEMNFPTAEAALEFARRKGWSHRLTSGRGRKPIPLPAAEWQDLPAEREVDETLEQSFAVSDAPSWTRSSVPQPASERRPREAEELSSNVVPLPLRKTRAPRSSEDEWPPGAA